MTSQKWESSILKTLPYLCFLILLVTYAPLSHSRENESWQMVESAHFQVYYHPHAISPQEIVDIAEDFYPTLDRLINGIPMDKIEIWVCETQEQFQAAVHAPIQDWAIGCAFPLSSRIVIQNPRVILQREFQLSQIIRHEIVHVVFGQRTQKTIRGIPLWFNEGVAIYLSGEWVPRRHELLLKHVFSKSTIPLSKLADEFPKSESLAQLAYAESLNAVTWLTEIAGVDKLWEIIDLLGKGNDLNTAYKEAIGWELATFDVEWRNSLPRRYHWAALFSSSHLFWGSLALLVVLVYLRSRYRSRQRLVELEQEDMEVDAFFKQNST